jgi:hypothetical protein
MLMHTQLPIEEACFSASWLRTWVSRTPVSDPTTTGEGPNAALLLMDKCEEGIDNRHTLARVAHLPASDSVHDRRRRATTVRPGHQADLLSAEAPRYRGPRLATRHPEPVPEQRSSFLGRKCTELDATRTAHDGSGKGRFRFFQCQWRE